MYGPKFRLGAIGAAVIATSLASTVPARAGADDPLLERIEQLEAELQALREQVTQTEETAAQAEETAEEARQTANAVDADVNGGDMSWHIAGYTHAGAVVTDGDSEDSFLFGGFNPAFHFQYRDLVMFEGELEVTQTDNETEVELENAQINLLLHDNLTIAAGKFYSPVGQFQERLHPAWINRLPDAPAGFGHGGIQPLTDVGLMARGGVRVNDDMRVNYAIAVGNGPRLGHGGVELEGFASDDNDNKSFAGRLGFFPIPELEVGGSFMVAELVGPENHETEMLTDIDFDLWGADFAYVRGPWRFRGEYLNAEATGFPPEEEHVEVAINPAAVDDGHGAEESLAEDTEWEAWYLELAYRMSGLTEHPVGRNFEPVVRYGEYEVRGDHEAAEQSENRFNVGLNYWFAPSIVLKASVEWRDFAADELDDETRLLFQLAYGF